MNMHRKPLQIFIQSPHLHQLRHESVTGDQTLADLKRSLFPESPHHHLSSFYFTFNGKPLPEETPLLTLRIAPLSTLVFRPRLRGGVANDGYLNIYAEKNPDNMDPNKQSLSKSINCTLWNEPLREPCVIDKLGNVFNKEALEGVLINGSEGEDEVAVLTRMKPSHQSIHVKNTDASSSSSSSDKEAENIDGTESGSTKRRKVATEEFEGSTLEGTMGQKLVAQASVDNVCIHPGSFRRMCIHCGQKLEEKSGVRFEYIHKGLRLHDVEISRLRNKYTKDLLCRKKLYLVLDLDQTLLHSVCFDRLSLKELYFLTHTDSLGDSFFRPDKDVMTKLRPFVRTFLKEASKYFEMYIYTMGDRRYARKMAKLLDPQAEYFKRKVISREDNTKKNQKGLDVVLGQESAVLILDDKKRVWTKHQDNLIMIKRYHYFSSDLKHCGFNSNSLAEMEIDEHETEGVLARMLNVLKQVHFTFFDKLEEDYVDRDVRKVLSSIRSEVLSGCVILFWHTKPASLSFLKEIAEQMGATCMPKLDPSVTHVVSTYARTEKFQWAEKEKKFLVHPHWIYDTYCCWQKQPEANYICKKIDRKTAPDTTTESGATTITATDSAAQPMEL